MILKEQKKERKAERINKVSVEASDRVNFEAFVSLKKQTKRAYGIPVLDQTLVKPTDGHQEQHSRYSFEAMDPFFAF